MWFLEHQLPNRKALSARCAGSVAFFGNFSLLQVAPSISVIWSRSLLSVPWLHRSTRPIPPSYVWGHASHLLMTRGGGCICVCLPWCSFPTPTSEALESASQPWRNDLLGCMLLSLHAYSLTPWCTNTLTGDHAPGQSTWTDYWSSHWKPLK